MKNQKKLAKALLLTLTLFFLIAGTGFTECSQDQIDPNTANVEELQQVKGIGAVLAQRIVDYRAEHPFQNVEEIAAVKGIGEKTLEKIQDAFCLE